MILVTIPGQPIHTTAQQQRFFGKGKNGRAIVVKTEKLKDAEKQLLYWLSLQAPKEPLTGPIELHVTWSYGTGDKKKIRQCYKDTRPDTDNSLKLLKDCLTKSGYWQDDAQVAQELLIKCWVPIEDAKTSIMINQLTKG